MLTKTASATSAPGPSRHGFDLRVFVEVNVTHTWYLAVWLLVLASLTVFCLVRQWDAAPGFTTVMACAWVAGLLIAIRPLLDGRHSAGSDWLRRNLYSSVSNSLLTLLLALLLASVARFLLDYAVIRATFDPNLSAPDRRPANVGASWGVIVGASKLLLTGTLEMVFMSRVWAAFLVVAALAGFTVSARLLGQWQRIPWLRRVLVYLWLLSPLVLYVLLIGVPSQEDPGGVLRVLLGGEIAIAAVYGLLYWQRIIALGFLKLIVWSAGWALLCTGWYVAGASGLFPLINVEHWGGLMLTLIIAVFSIILSFPLGVALALGRRSTARGIPAWITLPICGGLTLWGLLGSTPGLLATAQSRGERILAFWPLLIILGACLFQHFFSGRVIAAACTLYIEIVRGLPLITVLFMAIIMTPLFFPAGAMVKNTWAVLVGFTLFTAAYLAEVVRGGLQAIPPGQYEAADALGLNNLQKMRFVILPQALQIVIPAIVGLFVGTFKSSSLVGIVGLFDLMGIVASVTGNPRWQGLRTELYAFAAVVYFVGSYVMTSYSRRLETRLARGRN